MSLGKYKKSSLKDKLAAQEKEELKAAQKVGSKNKSHKKK